MARRIVEALTLLLFAKNLGEALAKIAKELAEAATRIAGEAPAVAREQFECCGYRHSVVVRRLEDEPPPPISLSRQVDEAETHVDGFRIWASRYADGTLGVLVLGRGAAVSIRGRVRDVSGWGGAELVGGWSVDCGPWSR